MHGATSVNCMIFIGIFFFVYECFGVSLSNCVQILNFVSILLGV